MDACNRKTYYYVSNIVTGTITIIDGSHNSIVKDVFVGKRPFNMGVMNNKLYVACDRSKKIAVVDCPSGEVKWLEISNNGNIEIDQYSNRIYTSDDSEIYIYDIHTGRLINRITGLQAIVCIKLNNSKTRLYVLDRLKCEFRIYNTDELKLIHKVDNIAPNAGYFVVSCDDRIVYISFENYEVNNESCQILEIDIEKTVLRKIYLEDSALIAGMALKETTLYAANKVMNRVDLIDTITYKTYGYILTSLPEPIRLILTEDDTKLLVVNRNSKERGGLDIIDTENNRIINSIPMDLSNTQPYTVVSVDSPVCTNSTVEDKIANSKKRLYTISNNGDTAKLVTTKVLAIQYHKIEFPQVVVNINNSNEGAYIFEQIKFKNGFVVKESEQITLIQEVEGSLRVQLIVRIPYIIYYIAQNENRYSHEGFLEKAVDLIVNGEQVDHVDGLKLAVETISKIKNIPKFIGNTIRLGIVTFIEVKVEREDIEVIPTFEECWDILGSSCLECLNKTKF